MKKVGVLVLGGLAALLAGCEKEEVLKGSGEMVAVNISLGDVVYDGNETVTRGYSPEMETVSVALGDGLFMYATIEKNREVETRAGEPLADGVKVRVVAYQGGTAKGTGEYTVKSGVLVSSNGSGFAVEEGEYNFVVYSYNSAISPDHSGAVVTVASPNDLLWGENKNKTISVSDNEVTITMRHMFAQVAVKAKMAGADITDMHGVTVSPGNSADLTVETGAVVKNAGAAAAKVPVSWGDEWVADEEVTSDPVVIYTGTNTFYVDMESISIEGYDVPFTNARATFNKVLTEGYSYTLVISFKRTRWAKSNIYWKSTGATTGYLTFDTNENSHQGYQGVYFKWGSLIGIAPVQPDAFSGDIPIYVPYNYTDAAQKAALWKATTGNTVATDVPGVAGGTVWNTWSANSSGATEIPYLDPNYTGANYGRDNRYAIDAAQNNETMYRKWRGDICQYLGKTGAAPTGYRLPTSNELGLVDAEFSWSATAMSSDGWKWGGSSFPSSPTNNAGYSNGRADLLSGVLSASYNSSLSSNAVGAVFGAGMNTTMGNVIFPAAGLRAGSNGMLSNVGNYGLYWSGSAIGDSYGLGMTFCDTYLDPSVQYNRSSAFSVRCIED